MGRQLRGFSSIWELVVEGFFDESIVEIKSIKDG
jgi:hypothetical protein